MANAFSITMQDIDRLCAELNETALKDPTKWLEENNLSIDTFVDMSIFFANGIRTRVVFGGLENTFTELTEGCAALFIMAWEAHKQFGPATNS